MKAHVWVLLFFISTSLWATDACRPPENRALIIGHTYDLDWFTTFRMKNSARLMGYKIRFKDLRTIQSDVEALRSIDALLIPGGADIHPNYYMRDSLPPEILATVQKFQSYYIASKEGEVRDPHEYSLLLTYGSSPEFTTLPFLGICRGMQMMAVAKGIPLIVDIKAELGIKNRHNRFDRFHVTDEVSAMGDLFPAGTNIGFKLHHQNPRMDYLQSYAYRHPEVKVTANSFKGKLVEAIEFTDRPALGLQFHPEKSLPKVKHRIFKWLLEKACIRSQQGVSK